MGLVKQWKKLDEFFTITHAIRNKPSEYQTELAALSDLCEERGYSAMAELVQVRTRLLEYPPMRSRTADFLVNNTKQAAVDLRVRMVPLMEKAKAESPEWQRELNAVFTILMSWILSDRDPSIAREAKHTDRAVGFDESGNVFTARAESPLHRRMRMGQLESNPESEGI